MQFSYLSFFWLRTIKQSFVQQQKSVKAVTPLLQIITPIGEKLLLRDRIIGHSQNISVFGGILRLFMSVW